MSRKTYGLIALIAGIIGFVSGGVGSIVGLVFAILGKKLPDDGDKQTTTFLTVGMILSIISLAFGVVCVACTICTNIGAAALSNY
jgi:ABC-type antimicrobial peptide transport system permease subunit